MKGCRGDGLIALALVKHYLKEWWMVCLRNTSMMLGGLCLDKGNYNRYHAFVFWEAVTTFL